MKIFDWIYNKNNNNLANDARQIGLEINNEELWKAFIMKKTKWQIVKLVIIAILFIGITVYMAVR